MSMHKGAHVGKYATLKDTPDGTDFRTIAKIMSDEGQVMSFGSARNVFLSGMEWCADAILLEIGERASHERVTAMARNPNFQSFVAETMIAVCSEDDKDDRIGEKT